MNESLQNETFSQQEELDAVEAADVRETMILSNEEKLNGNERHQPTAAAAWSSSSSKMSWSAYFLGEMDASLAVNNPEDAADPSDDDFDNVKVFDEANASGEEEATEKAATATTKQGERRRLRHYRDGITSFRSVWRAVKRFRATNAYVPTAAVVTDSTEIDYRSSILFGFSDSRLKLEYKRFLTRDVTTPIAGLPFLGGNLFYPLAQLVNTPDIWPYNFTGAGIMFVCMMIDIALHMFWPRRRNTPTIRRWMALLISLGVFLGITFTTGGMFKPCAVGSFAFRSDAYRARHTAKYCWDIIDTYGMASVVGCMTFLKLPSVIVFAQITIAYILWECGRYYYELDDVQRNGTIIVHFVVGAAALCLSTVYVVTRERLLQQQLIQAVRTARLRYTSEQRAKEADALLCAMVPPSVLSRVMENVAVRDATANATVFFSDMVRFTVWSATRTPREVLDLLNTLCIDVDGIATSVGVCKIKTIGDAYWAVTGLPDADQDHAQRMVRFGLLFQEAALRIARSPEGEGRGWREARFRVGIHSGPLQGAVLGTQSLSYEVVGSTSHVAEEVEKNGSPGLVVVSQATARLIVCLDNVGRDVMSLASSNSASMDAFHSMGEGRTRGGGVLAHQHIDLNGKLCNIPSFRPDGSNVVMSCVLMANGSFTRHGVVFPLFSVTPSQHVNPDGEGGGNTLLNSSTSDSHQSRGAFRRRRRRHSTAVRLGEDNAVERNKRRAFMMAQKEKARRERERELRAAEQTASTEITSSSASTTEVAETAEMLEQRLQQRKYSYILQNFRDEKLEQSYHEFTADATSSSRFWCYCALVLWLAILFAGPAIEDAAYSTTFYVLQSCAVTFSLALVFTWRWSTLWQVALVGLSSACALLGSWQLPYSAVGNTT